MKKYNISIVLDKKILLTLDFFSISKTTACEAAYRFSDKHFGQMAIELVTN